MDFSIGSLPVVGDLYKGITGDPEGIKKAYEDQIQASKESQQQLQNFLLGQKGKTLAYYGPIQHMFQNAYGTEGMMPQANTGAYPGGMGPIQGMYSSGGASAPPMPGGHMMGSSRAADELYQRPPAPKGTR